MKYLVVTPSFKQLDFLRRCVVSVADQSSEKIQVWHHVQDGGSVDGSVDWLEAFSKEHADDPNYQLTFASSPDKGMYDAINRGWSLADNGVDMVAHLNCDEQYLPGALGTIAGFFEQHREADVVLADMIVVNNEGAYVCHRRSLKPNRLLSRICCVGMTTTTFQRASVVRDKKVLFDTSWRNIGDMVWYNALHSAGVRFAVCNQLVSIFTDTGQNLNLTEEAIRERKRYADEYLWGMRRITRLVSKFYSLRRYLKEFYLTRPKEYALYWTDLAKRDVYSIKKPTGLWHRSGPTG